MAIAKRPYLHTALPLARYYRVLGLVWGPTLVLSCIVRDNAQLGQKPSFLPSPGCVFFLALPNN